jgi:peptide/nickel transport system substrate-binding protein
VMRSGRVRTEKLRALSITGAALVAIALTACGSTTKGSGSTNTSSSSSFPAAGAGHTLQTMSPPAKGPLSTVTWDLPFGEPVTLDYVKAGDFSPETVISAMCDDLVRLEPNFTYAPNIATSWRYVNPRTLVYTIRHGVHFWDGHLLTAADVAYSMNRNLRPSTGAINGLYYANVSKIEQTGPYQVTVRFSRPDESFNKEMSTVIGGIAEKSYIERVGDKAFGTAHGGVMCSGPFQFSSWQPGQQIVLKANPQYWNTALEPKVKTLIFKFISNTSTLTAALESGQIDGTFEVPPSSLPALSHTGVGRVIEGPSLEVEQLEPASTTGPMADPVLRRALALTIDRAAVARVVFDGSAQADRAIVPPTAWAGDPVASSYQSAWNALPNLSPDLAEAKKLVAGRPDAHQPITIAIAAGDAVQLRVGTLIQAQAQQIGLTVKLAQLQPTDYSNIFYIKSDREAAHIQAILTQGYLDIADPVDRLLLFIGKKALFNWTGYNNPRVTSDFQEAIATLDPEHRAALLNDAQSVYMKDMLVIPILNIDERTFLNNRITGVPTSFAYITSPWPATLGAAR